LKPGIFIVVEATKKTFIESGTGRLLIFCEEPLYGFRDSFRTIVRYLGVCGLQAALLIFFTTATGTGIVSAQFFHIRVTLNKRQNYCIEIFAA
jgi:hypothetical protein